MDGKLHYLRVYYVYCLMLVLDGTKQSMLLMSGKSGGGGGVGRE